MAEETEDYGWEGSMYLQMQSVFEKEIPLNLHVFSLLWTTARVRFKVAKFMG